MSAIENEQLQAIEGILRRVLGEVRSAEVEAELISPELARKFFSPAITKLTLRNWTEKGFIPVQRIGGRLFYRRADLLAAGTKLKKYKNRS